VRFEFVTAMDMKIPAFFSVLCCGVVWRGVLCCGVVWRGVLCCVVVWCGVAWCVVLWCGTHRDYFKFVRHVSKR
jgi:hypothetical protein